MAHEGRGSRDEYRGYNSPPSPIAEHPASFNLQQPYRDPHVFGAPSPNEFAYSSVPIINTIPEEPSGHMQQPSQSSVGVSEVSAFTTSSQRDPVSRVPVASRTPPAQATLGGAADYLSSAPVYERAYSSSTAYDPYAQYDSGNPQEDAPANRYSRRPVQQAVPVDYSSTARLARNVGSESIRSGQSRRSKFDNEFQPDSCPTHSPFYQGRKNWLAISILIMAIFSTVFSAVFFIIAAARPQWGRRIGSGGGMSASTANVITQLFAKLIELSFVTVFVAFLGQVLSRRAVSRESRGVTVAEMSMRNWVMQPGSIFTHYESVQFAALTFLGALSLTVAVMAILYTTAASALVSPGLRYGPYESKLLYGQIRTSFANPNYLAARCQTPIQSNSWDPNYSDADVSQTCETIEHAALAFHNYQQYMTDWTAMVGAGNGSDQQHLRPFAPGLFYQNTTVNGSWINIIDTKAVSTQFNRIINNVTLAMPHTGVFQAARDPLNNILQPEDLDGQGLYNIRASLPSPYVNVICVNVNETDIAPLVYSEIPDVVLNVTTDLPTAYTNKFDWAALAQLKTPLDEIFGWDDYQRPPVFYKFPTLFNTLLNNTAPWGQNAIYLLGSGSATADTDDDYFMCKILAGQTTKCSTQYQVQGNNALMRAHCEDPNDAMQYIRGNSSRVDTISLDYVNVAETAFNALSLNNGVQDGDASNARLLTQFMLAKGELNPSLPSPAEALAVLAGSTLLLSSQDSPFVEYYNYSSTTLDPPQIQAFNASVQAQQYSSGGTQNYQRGFYVVLLAVFLMNVFVLIYFIANRGLVTDFSEPPCLFSLAINSPPNTLMAGACGGGPQGKQFSVKFGVEMEGEHLYMTDKESGIYGAHGRTPLKESHFSFLDLFGRGGKNGNGGRWRQLQPDSNIEMGTRTAGYGGAEGQHQGPPAEVAEPQSAISLGARKPHLNLSKTFSILARRRSAL